MKKLTLILFLISTTLFSQEIPKGTDKIVIKNSKTASENFLAVKQILADKGIEIASQDKDVFQIKTGNLSVKTRGLTSYYLIQTKENTIKISGFFKSGILVSSSDTDEFAPIVNRGMSGSMFKVTFNAMNDFSRTLGTDITYEGGEIEATKTKKKSDDVYNQ